MSLVFQKEHLFLKNLFQSSHNNFYGIDVDTRRRNILILLLLQTPTETSINKLAELGRIIGGLLKANPNIRKGN